MAKQAMKQECDINVILAKYRKTGLITHMRNSEGRYIDVPAMDYQECLNVVIAARDLFDGQPAHIRKRFGNDPAEFLAFCENPENEEEMVKLGLANKRPPEAAETPSEASPSVETTETKPLGETAS